MCVCKPLRTHAACVENANILAALNRGSHQHCLYFLCVLFFVAFIICFDVCCFLFCLFVFCIFVCFVCVFVVMFVFVLLCVCVFVLLLCVTLSAYDCIGSKKVLLLCYLAFFVCKPLRAHVACVEHANIIMAY